MGGVVVVGGSVIGLTAAMALARQGHSVTVLERDDAAAPSSKSAAWSDWDRKGVAQFRQFHAYTALARRLLSTRLSDLYASLLENGAMETPLMDELSRFIGDFEREPEDAELVLLRCRRVTLEWVVRQAALREPGVSWRPGVRATGVLLSPDGSRVAGVLTDDGGSVPAELVVDASGRRSSLAGWLADAGVDGRVADDVTETGIVYYTRWYRIPAMRDFGVGVRLDMDFTRCLLAAVDDDFASLAFMAAADDEPLRLLGQDAVFQAFAESLPPLARWLGSPGAEPMSKVLFMGGLRNRWREVSMPGVVAVGDALMCTNPYFGRGVSLGLTSVFALVDAVSACGGLGAEVAACYGAAVRSTLRPWYDDGAAYDTLRTLWLRAARGDSLTPAESALVASEECRFHRSVGAAMMLDAKVMRGFMRWLQSVDPPERFAGDPEMRARVLALLPEPAARREGLPSRDEVVALLTSAAAGVR